MQGIFLLVFRTELKRHTHGNEEMSKNSAVVLIPEIYQQGISFGKMLKYLLFSIFSDTICLNKILVFVCS